MLCSKICLWCIIKMIVIRKRFSLACWGRFVCVCHVKNWGLLSLERKWVLYHWSKHDFKSKQSWSIYLLYFFLSSGFGSCVPSKWWKWLWRPNYFSKLIYLNEVIIDLWYLYLMNQVFLWIIVSACPALPSERTDISEFDFEGQLKYYHRRGWFFGEEPVLDWAFWNSGGSASWLFTYLFVSCCSTLHGIKSCKFDFVIRKLLLTWRMVWIGKIPTIN